MTYIPVATQTTEPVESRTVESAALEFRTLKTRTNLLEVTVAANLVTLQAADALEIVTRTNADNAIVASISPYLDQVALVNFPNNFDLGFVSDPVAPLNIFDFGSI